MKKLDRAFVSELASRKQGNVVQKMNAFAPEIMCVEVNSLPFSPVSGRVSGSEERGIFALSTDNYAMNFLFQKMKSCSTLFPFPKTKQ
jgi:hypothetical protein